LSLKTKVDGLSLVWPQTSRAVSPGFASKPMATIFLVWHQNHGWRFLGFSLKTKQTSVCRLHQKIDGGRTTQDTRRDLVACFAWKQVTIEFLKLSLRLAEARLWMVHVTSSWRLHREEAEDGWIDAMSCIRLFYPKITVSNILSLGL
jgi:hypothetical protein